ncbi:MAG: stealth family protein [Catenisphaera adipataccumulans]|uniref:stealth family protein n=1 Tax=Catenisphaera adipataccumulans TaxID=700500 RepID=UPI003D8E4594
MDAIDFVLIWVDNTDPKWQKEKKRYSIKEKGYFDDRDVRYRDWNNIKYWFRGVEKYASWVNKVYFVTCGQKPKWMNSDCPKLVLVDHKDFIPEEYLPTFNANTIELNLHRIKNLSNRFVFFNDDMFIINSTKPEDFFINNSPRDLGILEPIFPTEKKGVANIQTNNIEIINSYFKKNDVINKNYRNWFNKKYGLKNIAKNLFLMPYDNIPGFYEPHIASNFLKSTYFEIWDKEYSILDQTCRHKFRNVKQDVNQWLIRDWQLCKNAFIPRKANFGKYYDIDHNSDFNKIIVEGKEKMICLNDIDDQVSENGFNDMKNRCIKAFEKKFPEKSSFEI